MDETGYAFASVSFDRVGTTAALKAGRDRTRPTGRTEGRELSTVNTCTCDDSKFVVVGL